MTNRSIAGAAPGSEAAWPVSRLVAVAACIGLLGGLGEVLLLGVLKYAMARPFWLGPHVVWMAPLSAAALTMVIAATPGLLTRVWSPRSAVPLTIGLSVFAASWALLILLPGLHEKALLIPAAGLGYQAHRYAARRPGRTWSVVRLVSRWALGLVAAMGLVVGAVEVGGPRLRATRLPPASPGAPHVLLLVMDTQRAASMSLYGYPRRTTPVLDSLAGEAAVFDRAISVAAWTLPGHAGFFTGRYPHQIRWKPLDRGFPTLAEALTRAGYFTGGFVANTFFTQREFGLGRGFLHYEDFVVTPVEILINSSLARRLGDSGPVRRLLGYHDIFARRNAEDINRQFLRWLDRRPKRPVFAFLNYYDVHEPYLPPAPFGDVYTTRKDQPRIQLEHDLRQAELRHGKRRALSERARRAEQDAYDGAVGYLDREIGWLLGELRRRRLLDSTLVIVTSDHGELFGEHGLFLHGNSLYSQVVHVPLILRFPGRVPVGVRIAQAVSLRDLPATVLELTRARVMDSFPGSSLSRYWKAGVDTVIESPAFSALVDISGGGHHSLVSTRFHYIRMAGRRAKEMLFDLDTDPEEREDLASRPDLAPVMDAFRRQVEAIVADSSRATKLRR